MEGVQEFMKFLDTQGRSGTSTHWMPAAWNPWRLDGFDGPSRPGRVATPG